MEPVNTVDNLPTRPRGAIPLEVLIDEVVRCKGMVSTAARNLKVSRQAIYKRMERSPKLREAIGDCREITLDTAETKLFDAIEAGDLTAIKYYLSTQGRARGYVTKSETDLTSDGRRLQFTLNVGNAPDADDSSAE